MLNTFSAYSNNVQISNVRLTGQDTTNNFTMVEFDISWENSWRYSAGPANWDAAWVFVKYRVGSGGQWQHASLNNTGHTVCSGSAITNGFLNPGLPFNSSTNPSLGIFLYRSTPGSGTFLCPDVQLRWNYGINSVSDNAQVDIKVFAIEMVYIPSGSFYVGSGGSESGAFYKYPNTGTPYFISSENAITVGTGADNLFYPNQSGEAGDQDGPVPAVYPKGFNAFYAMKYEVSQQGYVDFLNTLTRIQQMARVEADISGTSVTNIWVMCNSASSFARSYIKCRPTIPPQPSRVAFLVDQNGNHIGDEETDGLNVACGLLSYGDLSAYLDWAALRLMTEFEFEKCGRGIEAPVPNEFAWGDNAYFPHSGVDNINMPTEVPTDPMSNVASYSNAGPLRVGIFARTNTDRPAAGAGYYGCMELNSNLLEIGANIGSAAGRAYTGNHGDGSLSADGKQNVAFWPDPVTAIGIFFRGGSYVSPADPLSGRKNAALLNGARNAAYGARGVRTAQ